MIIVRSLLLCRLCAAGSPGCEAPNIDVDSLYLPLHLSGLLQPLLQHVLLAYRSKGLRKWSHLSGKIMRPPGKPCIDFCGWMCVTNRHAGYCSSRS